jgi:HSP20 family protein
VITVLRFDPIRDIDRLTEQLLGAPAGSSRVPRFMPMDLFRSGDHYVLHADLPGVDPGSIDLSVDADVLTVRAERSPRSEDGAEWVVSERFTGTFQRQIALGDGLDPERISATYDAGVLTVTLPVAARAKSRKISVETAGDHRIVESKAEPQPDHAAAPSRVPSAAGRVWRRGLPRWAPLLKVDASDTGLCSTDARPELDE